LNCQGTCQSCRLDPFPGRSQTGVSPDGAHRLWGLLQMERVRLNSSKDGGSRECQVGTGFGRAVAVGRSLFQASERCNTRLAWKGRRKLGELEPSLLGAGTGTKTACGRSRQASAEVKTGPPPSAKPPVYLTSRSKCRLPPSDDGTEPE
jgi:hypothetical protein